MTALKIAAAAVCGVLLLAALKRNSQIFAVLGETALVAVVLLAVLPEVKEVYESCSALVSGASVSSEIIKTMFKSFGILAVGSVAADICRDNSESAVAGMVEVCVKVVAIACALPIFSAVFAAAVTLFG